MKTQSSELQRKAEENDKNVRRHMEWLKKSAIHRYVKNMSDYRDKRVCKEYERWLDGEL